MKHTTLICAVALTLGACTCTCPENKYDVQAIQPTTQYTYQQPQNYGDQGTLQYYRYTQVRYTAPQPKPEVVYYPVYQQPQVIYKQESKSDCCFQETFSCGC